MVLINLGDSQDSADGSSDLGLHMERSQSSASSYESNPEPPAPLRQGQQRPGRPPFRTQLSEPNWTGPLGPSPALSMLNHASIASPDSELSADSQSATALYAPEHFRHEPFSVFYGTGGMMVNGGGMPFCCGGGQFASLEPFPSELENNGNGVASSAAYESGPFIFSSAACAWLSRLFQQKIPTELREQLIADMLQMHTARFDKNRRSSLAPAQGDFGSATAQGQNQLSPYGPESLFFCIGQAGSRKNSFAGPSPTGQCFFAGGQAGSAGQEIRDQQKAGQQGQKQQKRKRAVITVDANTTQILIASDSVCRLFGFRDRSLIGKKLGQVFPVAKSALDLPDGTRGPLLLQNVFFTDFDQQRQLKPVYGRPVDILDADGQRVALSVWAYPLAGASSSAAPAPRKNSAILLRSPSAFLPSFMPFPTSGPISSSVTTTNSVTGPPGGPFGVPAANGAARASQPMASTDSGSTKVSPPTLYTLNNNSNNNCCSSPQSSSYHNNKNQQPQSVADLLPSQRTNAKPSSSSSSSSATAGFAPQLKEVLEEEQQHQQQNSNHIQFENRLPASCSTKQSTATSPSSTQSQQQSGPQTAFEPLNEPGRCPVHIAQQQPSSTEQQSATAGTGTAAEQLSRQTTDCCLPKSPSSPPSTSAQGAAMVQAGVQLGNGLRSGNGSSGNNHHRKESTEGAVIIIPINRAEMDAEQAEPQQKGFLRRQHNCSIQPNTSAGTATNSTIIASNPVMAIGLGTPTAGGAEMVALGANMSSGNCHQQNGHPNSASSCHPSQRGAAGNEQQQQNERWLILMEPLNALFASVILGQKGRIFRVDDAFPTVATILGYESTNRLLGTEIQRLIPSLNIGAEYEAKEQLCCASTVKHNGIPMNVTVRATRDQESGAVFSYEVQIRSIASINGVVTLTESGTVYSYNENLFHELLGMHFCSEMNGHEQSKLDITDVIPHFYEYMEVAHFHIRRHRHDQLQNGTSAEHTNAHHRHPSAEPSISSAPFMPTVSHSSSCLFTQELATARRAFGRRSNSFYGGAMPRMREDQAEDEDQSSNQLSVQQQARRPEIIPGIFYGLARHADGMMIPVKIEVSNLDNNHPQQHQNGTAQQQPRLYAVCIGFDRTLDWGISQLSEEEEEQHEEQQQQAAQQGQDATPAQTAASNGALCGLKKKAHFSAISGSSTLLDTVPSRAVPRFSIGGGSLRDCDSDSAVDFVSGATTGRIISDDFLLHAAELKMQEVTLSALEDENNEAVRGEYSKHYNTFQLIGNGAFGSVKLAARKDSGLLAVSKFICKEKILPESWVASPKRSNRMVPIEVHLLENLHHPNIVRVLDVFENDKYYQLVMEKCGCGMDLFEFIDHQPRLDEPLISHIFRQIVSAVDYLHQNHIVHRDLKDENVIIDQHFNCKLIDFGSAAFFGEGIVFSTFCGTMEYCAPEVLTGNKYLGPELEMWSMGILLYTLVFFENPFRSPQETVRADVELPWDISEGLYQVLSWLLQPDPRLRATVGEIKRHWWLTQEVDPRRYNFRELLRNCDRAQVEPPLYVSDLHNHLKNASASCSNLAGVSITSALNAEVAATGNGPKGGAQDAQQQQMGIVSAR